MRWSLVTIKQWFKSALVQIQAIIFLCSALGRKTDWCSKIIVLSFIWFTYDNRSLYDGSKFSGLESRILNI